MHRSMRRGPRRAATLVLTVMAAAMALVASEAATAQITKRPLSDFISKQGTTVNWWPPVADYLGWTSGRTNAFALVDYAGIANEWLKANGGPDLGTMGTGSIFEEELPDGRAQVTVNLITTDAMAFASALDPWGEMWFGNQAPDIKAGALPAIGSCQLTVVFINTAPGADLPNLVEAMVLGVAPPGYETVFLSFMCEALGTLHSAAGLGPDGTASRLTVAQMGIFTADNQGGIWPVETVSLEITAPRQAMSIWVLPRDVQRGTKTYLRAYVRRLPDYTWLANIPVGFALDGTSLGFRTTNAAGSAAYLYAVPADWPLGDHTLVCTFSGDAIYQPATGSATITCVP